MPSLTYRQYDEYIVNTSLDEIVHRDNDLADDIFSNISDKLHKH